jgi:hypothetical protein
MAVLGYLEVKHGVMLPDDHIFLIFLCVPLMGILICRSWWQTIRSYRQLARAKFKVLHTLEHRLPARLFETEWELLGKGKDRRAYYPLSRIERSIPVTFMALYLVIICANIPVAELAQLVQSILSK